MWVCLCMGIYMHTQSGTWRNFSQKNIQLRTVKYFLTLYMAQILDGFPRQNYFSLPHWSHEVLWNIGDIQKFWNRMHKSILISYIYGLSMILSSLTFLRQGIFLWGQNRLKLDILMPHPPDSKFTTMLGSRHQLTSF